MKLRKLVLACAIVSPCVSAFEVCNIGDEYNVLDRESFHDIRKSNYRNFSEDLTPEDLFLSAPEHNADARPSLAEADEVLAGEGWAAHDRMRTALRLSGLTPSEARAAVRAANANLGVAELSEALQAILGGVEAKEAAASAGPAPEAPAA